MLYCTWIGFKFVSLHCSQNNFVIFDIMRLGKFLSSSSKYSILISVQGFNFWILFYFLNLSFNYVQCQLICQGVKFKFRCRFWNAIMAFWVVDSGFSSFILVNVLSIIWIQIIFFLLEHCVFFPICFERRLRLFEWSICFRQYATIWWNLVVIFLLFF